MSNLADGSGVIAQQLVGLLLARHNSDGGWGAHADLPSNAECTALACLALRDASTGDRLPADAAAALGAGEAWLLARQQPSGAWRYTDAGAPATWPTPLVLIALLRHAPARDAVVRGYDWLLELRGERFPWRQRLREFIAGKQIIELDSTLDGWPWTPGAFSWVEPTSWALAALKARWPARAPRPARKRIRLGEKMLADRACPGGGWNYGNSRVMDQDLDPYPDTTALALIGLRGRRGDVIESGFSALDRLLGAHASGLALSLAVLSHRGWQRSNPALTATWQEYAADRATEADHRTLAIATIAAAPRLAWLGVNAHA